MKKAALLVLILLVGGLTGTALIAARFESTVTPNCFLGSLAMGGLTRSQALTRLQAWWQTERAKKIALTLSINSVRTRAGKGSALSVPIWTTGIAPDFSQSVAQLPMTDLIDSARTAVGGAPASQILDIKFVQTAPPSKAIEAFALGKSQHDTAARVYFHDGSFDRSVGQGQMALDQERFTALLGKALTSDSPALELPTSLQQRVTAADLSQIDSVMSTFTTHFPVRKRDRNTNIRIAARKINGWVLLPGDRFSFNTVVGRRTIEDGFKEAPVFKNGGHGIDVGGGICQVSTTLYNSALFADLKIVQRHNHSMPVAYVPLGRDATVDYGSLDLVIQNSLSIPIALCSEYRSGILTFRILGRKDPALKVKIVTENSQSWDAPTKTVHDPKLPLGSQKILEKGSRGHSILSYRLVYHDDLLVAKEPLGRSFYRGGERIVAIGSGPAVPPLGAPPITNPTVIPNQPASPTPSG